MDYSWKGETPNKMDHSTPRKKWNPTRFFQRMHYIAQEIRRTQHPLQWRWPETQIPHGCSGAIHIDPRTNRWSTSSMESPKHSSPTHRCPKLPWKPNNPFEISTVSTDQTVHPTKTTHKINTVVSPTVQFHHGRHIQHMQFPQPKTTGPMHLSF